MSGEPRRMYYDIGHSASTEHYKAMSVKIGVISSTVFLLALLYPTVCVQSQVGRSKSSAVKKSSIDGQATDVAKARRDEAVSLLMSLVADSQEADTKSRSHLQAHAAHLLWKVDSVLARELFLKAWSAAEMADRKDAQDQSGAESKGPNYISPRDARREVILLALQNDRLLGEELLARMSKETKSTANNDRSDPVADQTQSSNLSPNELDRLSVARELLEDGNSDQAEQLAGQTLYKTVIPSLRFLAELRERNQTAADKIYVSLLTQAQADPRADANVVSLLSSYVFSPDVYVRIGANGFPTVVQINRTSHAVDVSSDIRLAFLKTAAQILIKQTSDPASQRAAFMIGTRLLPLFDQFTPSLANDVRTKLIQLSPSISPALKTFESTNKVRKGIGPADSETNNVEELVNQADLLTDGNARDRLFVRAAIIAAEHGDNKAEKIAQKVANEEIREHLREYVLMALAKSATDNKQIDRALELARSPELSAIERVWIYIQVTNLIGGKKKLEAADTLFEVLPIARKMETDAEKAQVMTAFAVQLMKFKRELAKGYVEEAISISNKLDNFTGEETTFNVRIESSVGGWQATYGSPTFSLTGLFRELANEDFFQAINTADSLKSKQLRSEALLTIARSALSEGAQPITPPQRY